MKSKKKLLAALLCAALALCLALPAAFAENDGEAALAGIDDSGASKVEVSVDPVKDVQVKKVAAKGEKTRLTASVPEADAEKVASWQWQVLADKDNKVWADISGETGKKIELTYGMVRNVLDQDGAARLRAVALDANGDALGVSDTVLVGISDEEKAEEKQDEPKAEEPRAGTFSLRAAASSDDGDASAQAEGDLVSVVIEYKFADGTQAAPSWSAQIAVGSSLQETVASPEVEGYAPFVDYDDGQGLVDAAEVALDYEVVGEDGDIITVFYQPAKVRYSVEHYWQNVDDDEYSLHETTTAVGYTESPVGDDLAKTYDGFYALAYDPSMEIAADGSTVVKVYYDRIYYLMTFGLDGGYGVEPIYARYGAKVSVGSPTKAGYTFGGWSPALPATVPLEGGHYNAQWTNAQQVEYTVVYWKENADNGDYSYWGSEVKAAIAGSTVSGSDTVPASVTTATVDGQQLNEKPYFTYNDAKTDKNVAIKGDGSSVVNVYYTRNVYTIYFKGYGKCCLDEHVHSDGCLTCTLEIHSRHESGCYAGVGDAYNSHPSGAPWRPTEGLVYQSGNSKYIYINGSWYRYTGAVNSGQTAEAVCGKPIHASHTASCYDCGLNAHSHTNNCNTNRNDNIIYVLSAKYEATIGDIWPTATIIPDNANGSAFRGWGIDDVSSESVSKRITMTANLCDTSDGEKNATAKYGASYYVHLYYMFESFDQTSPASGNDRKLYNGKYYDKSDLFYQDVNANSNSFSQKEITGVSPVGVATERVGSNGSMEYNNFLYYDRNRSDLKFQSLSTVVETVSGVMYEQPLKDYVHNGRLISSIEPDYPSTYEAGAYEFEGWYTTPGCVPGTKFDFETATMPNGELTLYANWVPVIHAVRVFLTEEDAASGSGQIGETLNISHGDMVSAEDVPEDPERGQYSFVGWFYMDGGVEKAFDFANMPVTKDLVVYAKWSSKVLVEYEIRYELEDGTPVADSSTGKALAAFQQTFEAKSGNDLYSAYRSGYFPVAASHSIDIDIDPDNNVYTFVYKAADKVPYVVEYLDKATGKPVVDENGKVYASKEVESSAAIVTENYQYIPGFMPDAYQKRLVLSLKAEENVITFWYVADEQHAPVHIVHKRQNIEGDGYEDYRASTDLSAIIGQEYGDSILDIKGFEYVRATVNGEDVTPVDGEVSAKLTDKGLEIVLYYDRIKYPYEFRFEEQGTNKELAADVTGSARYQAQVPQSAKAVPGYTLVSADRQVITIAVEDPANAASKNVKVFYYTENEAVVNYKVVGPERCGAVSVDTEKTKVKTGALGGSTPEAEPGYKFVGWYEDQACTKAVPADWVSSDGHVLPRKNADDLYESATYYAKFERATVDLAIKKVLSTSEDKGQTFMFSIVGKSADGEEIDMVVSIQGSGSIVVADLPVGTYTVTELIDWSWRYELDGADVSKTLTVGEDATVVFTNKKSIGQWLSDESIKSNVFTGKGY